MITQLVWTTWTPMSAVPQKAVKLTHSCSLSVCGDWSALHWQGSDTGTSRRAGRRAEWLHLYCKVGGELNDFVSIAKWEESWMTSSLLQSGRRAEWLRLYYKVGGELNDFVSIAKWEESWMTSSLLQSKSTWWTPDLTVLVKLTYWGLVTPYGDRDPGQFWLR